MPTERFCGSFLTECPYCTCRIFFLHEEQYLRKARELELATFHENRRVVGMLNPMREKNEGTYRRGEGMTPVTKVMTNKYMKWHALVGTWQLITVSLTSVNTW